MNEQEKVYKVIQAAVKKLQEKGMEINEEQFVQLIQDTYKKAATKEEGDKAVKDMFSEIFKDEQKMFKDGGKMESAVNLFKCGGKSKSKASKKVEKRQEGGDIDEAFRRYNHDGKSVKEMMIQDGYGEDWKRFDKTGQYYRSVIYPQDGYGADTTYSFYPTYGERYEIRANKDGRTGNFSNIYGEYKNLSKEEMSKIADMINKKVGNILSKQNGGQLIDLINIFKRGGASRKEKIKEKMDQGMSRKEARKEYRSDKKFDRDASEKFKQYAIETMVDQGFSRGDAKIAYKNARAAMVRAGLDGWEADEAVADMVRKNNPVNKKSNSSDNMGLNLPQIKPSDDRSLVLPSVTIGPSWNDAKRTYYDDMTFNKAFALARKKALTGGDNTFFWRGTEYGTLYENETPSYEPLEYALKHMKPAVGFIAKPHLQGAIDKYYVTEDEKDLEANGFSYMVSTPDGLRYIHPLAKPRW